MNSLNATDRLRRLLAVIPWVVDRGGASLSEISSYFDYPAEQLVTDLEEVLFMVGVHPFTPDCLVDVFISDGFVEISYADWFRKPLHLSPEEMFRLIVAGKSVSEYLGTDELGSLERGLMKLAAASGSAVEDAVEVNLGIQDRGVLEIFKEAQRENRRLRIKYYSYGKNEENSREIDIYRLFADKGHWYAEAYCHKAEGLRIFRLDRVRQVENTDEVYIPNDELLESFGSIKEIFSPKEGTVPSVVLLLPEEEKWVIDEYPHYAAVQEENGDWKVEFPVASPAWLARLLLRLGPNVQLVKAPESLGETFRREVAQSILKGYEEATPQKGQSGVSS